MPPVLDIQNLNVSYVTRRGVARAVRNVSFAINPGEAYGLVGESGCGKSTVSLSIMRYLPRQARMDGKILFNGQNLIEASGSELQHMRGNRIAMVYQDPQSSLNPVIDIETQLIEVITAHEKVSRAEARERCIAMLNRVRMPDPAYVLKRYPHQLSGGMQQRVVIAMALLLRPELVLMDEPTTGLDVTVEAGVLDLLDDLRREFRMAILYISHNLGVVARICDRVGVMYAGEIVEEAPTTDLFAHPNHPYTVGLLRCVPRKGLRHSEETLYSIPGRVPSLTALPPGCVFASRCALAEDACRVAMPAAESVAPDHIVRCIRWQVVTKQPTLAARTEPLPPRTETTQRELLRVNNLKVYFSRLAGMLGFGQRTQVKVIDDVSFDLSPQRTLGIVGESGCGKSTIARALAGLTPVTDGTVTFAGDDFSAPVQRRSRDKLQQLQMVFQNPDSSLNPRHTVYKALSRPLRRFNRTSRADERQAIIALLEAVNLDESYLDRRPRQMSGGEKQRVAIARAFAGNPELVLCDEPISSLDVSVQAAVLNLLQRLQRERKVALMFIAHDLNVVRYLSDQVAVIYLGHIMEIGPTEAIFSPPYHPYTEALISAIPVADPDVKVEAIRLEGSVPSPANPPRGCPFHTRCPRRMDTLCDTVKPPFRDAGNGHTIYCHIPLEDLIELQTGQPVSLAQ
ncbi:MAG: ABC transporter ATP-binding protein [Anaerolineae bacterium]|nr:ABC transporter ATP-binding protein [Anaerolineae bacterium]